MSHWNDNLPAQELDLFVLFSTLQIRKASISTILTDSDISTTKQLRDQTYTALKEFQIPNHPTCVKLVLSNSARRFIEACWAFNQRLANRRPPNGNTTSASG